MTSSTKTFQSLVDDGALAVGDGYRAKNEELGVGGPVFLRAAYLQNSGFDLRNSEHFHGSVSLADFGPKVSRIGDVVVTTKGNSTGRVGVIRDDQADAVYSPHLSYWRSLKPECIDPRFLYYWALSDEFLSQLAGMAHSTDMAPYLSLRDQLRLRISLPPPSAQAGIGATLGALDDKIELNRRMNETLEAMARAIFKDWFVDFGPTRAKMEGKKPYLAPDLWSLFPNRFNNNGMPEGWDIGPAASLVHFNPSERVTASPAPYIEMAAVPTTGSWPERPVLREPGSGAKFRNGDTVFARITPCLENGKTAFIQCLEEGAVAWGSTEFIVMRSRPPLPAAYSYLLARDTSFRTHAIQSMTGTSGRQRAQAEALGIFPVTRTSGEVAKAFGTVVDPCFAKIKANSEECETLAALRDLLLPKLMSGEIRVKDAVRIAGEA